MLKLNLATLLILQIIKLTISVDVDIAGVTGTKVNIVYGSMAGDDFGVSSNYIGDFNGDGISDIIVGAYTASPLGRSAAGYAYVIYGQTGGLTASIDLNNTLDPSQGLQIIGGFSSNHVGYYATAAGDFNGDGINDIAVASDLFSPLSRSGAGMVYVIYGKSGGYSSAIDLSLALDPSVGFKIYGAKAGDQFGVALGYAGDFNNDGIDDIIAGAAYSSVSTTVKNTGAVYIIYGQKGGYSSDMDLYYGINSTQGLRIGGAKAGDYTGKFVYDVGDLNNDGIDDVGFGSNTYSPLGRTGAGIVYILYGKQNGYSSSFNLSNGLNSTQGFMIYGAVAGDGISTAISYAGDFNNDGIDDLLVGASSSTPSLRAKAGTSYIIYGKTGGYSSPIDLYATQDYTQLLKIIGASAGDSSGKSVNRLGDFNRDGIDDIIIGASSATTVNHTSTGIAYVIYGRKGGYSINIDLSALTSAKGFRILGNYTGDGFGKTVSSAGDFDNDGHNDILVTAYLATANNRTSAGAAYIVYYAASLAATTVVNSKNNDVIGAIVVASIFGVGLTAFGIFFGIRRWRNSRKYRPINKSAPAKH